MDQQQQTLLKRRQQIEEELRTLQNDIYQSEEDYLQETWNTGGNVVKGFEGYLSNKTSHLQRFKSSSASSSSSTSSSSYKIKEKDRIFSDSSKFLKFDKNGRLKQTLNSDDNSTTLSYGRIEFVDESSLIWDPVPIIASSSAIIYNYPNNNNNIISNNNNNSQQTLPGAVVMENGGFKTNDNNAQQLMPPPPKQKRTSHINK